MSELLTRLEVEDLKENLREVQELLHRHALVEGLVSRQEMPRHALVEQLVHKQHLAELRAKLENLHSADIAYILEALPLEERLVVWELVKANRDGEILLEVSDAVRESLIASMDSDELVAAVETLEADELADLAADLPAEVIQEVVQSLPAEERERLRSALSYPEGTVGALMDFEMVTVREDVTLEAVTRYLRRMDELPDHTDQLYVVDRERRLRGTLPLARLIVSDLDAEVASVMVPERVTLHPQDRASDVRRSRFPSRVPSVSRVLRDPRGCPCTEPLVRGYGRLPGSLGAGRARAGIRALAGRDTVSAWQNDAGLDRGCPGCPRGARQMSIPGSASACPSMARGPSRAWAGACWRCSSTGWRPR